VPGPSGGEADRVLGIGGEGDRVLGIGGEADRVLRSTA
jgi:hypothetical protein